MDVLCALSTCPGGDLSTWSWDESEGGSATEAMIKCCRPLAVEVYSLTDEAEILQNWSEPEPAGYKGFHGLQRPDV